MTTPSPPRPRTADDLRVARRVLLVEDNPADAWLTQHALRTADPATEVETASRLSEVTTARLTTVDCVVVDLSLPDARGVEAVVRLRRLHGGVPVVVLTGDDDLATAAAALQHGAQDYLLKGSADGDALDRAVRYAQERKRLESALAHQALHDPLTGLANRTLFRDRVEHALERVRRHGTSAAVLFCDLDHFKGVNDSLGHSAGDELLVTVAQRLRTALREGDTLARFGGDEFTVLAEDLASPEQAGVLAARVQEALALPVAVGGQVVHVGVSTGIVLARPADDPETLLRDADIALYAAKEAGRGRVAWFDDRLHAAVVRRVALESDLREAVREGTLSVAYQPVVDTSTGEAVLVEALVRWHHPVLGPLPPSEFLGVAEQCGVLAALDRLVLARAVRDVARWRAAGRGWVPVSVNLSGRALADPGLVDDVLGVLAREGVPTSALVLEIVEDASVDVAAAGRLAALREAGVRLALDDFGAGPSSLQQFLTLSVDVLKLDGALLQAELGAGDRGRTLLGLLARVGEDLGVHVVAEGVETAAQLAVVQALGLRLGQGHLWARAAEPPPGGVPYAG
ncbi:MAG TPA: EAL domain-containing protein, partial [Mycobacteriales bacterium]|nr:EAL domain-containing protein [Mycobacteriales bacterium]